MMLQWPTLQSRDVSGKVTRWEKQRRILWRGLQELEMLDRAMLGVRADGDGFAQDSDLHGTSADRSLYMP